MTSTCSCICQQCAEGKLLCPTSNICVNATSWCDGVEDCPDDETNCTSTTTESVTIPTTTEPLENKCPEMVCPPKYELVAKLAQSDKLRVHLPTMFSTYGKKVLYKERKKTAAVHKRLFKKLQRPNSVEDLSTNSSCTEFECVSKVPPTEVGQKPKPCPPVTCPQGYDVGYNLDKIHQQSCPR